ncbi:MAG: BrnA antitoxin family protein [Alphaproteobacteria bacterium]|nr:BrnA antitoxin family protein [Alphaproteobacteria bacterium]
MSRKKLIAEQIEQLTKLAELPDDQIDTIDIPEVPAENWIFARRGSRFRPVTLLLENSVVAWFREHAPEEGFQSEINRVLRQHVADAEKLHT